MVLRSFLLIAALLADDPARAAETRISGPVLVHPVRIIDGDTFVGDALVWPGHVVRVAVRLRGIDAPEIRSRCPAERDDAQRARAALDGLVGEGPVWLSDIAGGKYFGRVIADVATQHGDDIAVALLRQRLVRPYDGGKRQPVC